MYLILKKNEQTLFWLRCLLGGDGVRGESRGRVVQSDSWRGLTHWTRHRGERTGHSKGIHIGTQVKVSGLKVSTLVDNQYSAYEDKKIVLQAPVNCTT